MIIVALSLLGLCFGSFVSALTWRLHELETNKKLKPEQKRELSMVHGRSMCPHCHHGLAWYDLLPVVSWLTLGGKCRYCGKPIEDSPLVEVVTAVLFAVSYLSWPYGFDPEGVVLFGLWLVFLVGFVALAVYDLKWMLLPNKIVYPLIALVACQTVLKLGFYDVSDVLSEAVWGFVGIGGMFYALFQLSKGKWLGGGDVKLAFMIGPLVGGPLSSVLTIFLASFMGTLVSLPLLVRRSLHPTSRIPFGPFLLAATVVVYLYGVRIADWYTSIFL